MNIDFLYKDKSKLLEGLCVENEFKKVFKFPMSEGWWCIPSQTNNNTSLIFFYLIYDNYELNETTYKVLNKLLESNQKIYIVKYESEFLFKKIGQIHDALNLENDNYISLESFKNSEGFFNSYYNFQATESTTDRFKTQRVIQYFENEGILKKVYLERLFANEVLSGHLNTMPINLDSITVAKDDKLVVLEIKFKYPSKQNTYGINIGQAEVLLYLIQLGFSVFHFIAKNPSNNEQIGIFEIQHHAGLLNNFYWYYKQLTLDDFSSNVALAPSKTSIDGKSRQKYIEISADDFSIQPVGNQHLLVPPLNGEYPLSLCPKCSSTQKIVHHNDKFFIGCTNFKNCRKLNDAKFKTN